MIINRPILRSKSYT